MSVGGAGGRLAFGLGAVPYESVFTTSSWGSRTELGEQIDEGEGRRVGVERRP